MNNQKLKIKAPKKVKIINIKIQKTNLILA